MSQDIKKINKTNYSSVKITGKIISRDITDELIKKSKSDDLNKIYNEKLNNKLIKSTTVYSKNTKNNEQPIETDNEIKIATNKSNK